MKFHKNTHDGPKFQKNGHYGLIGFDEFKKSLERDFFAESEVHVESCDKGNFYLTVYLNCNLNLSEALYHMKKGGWGVHLGDKTNRNSEFQPLQSPIYKLMEHNTVPIDIEELTIDLKDTSIVISKIYDRSISDQLGTILSAIGDNFIHFTNGLDEMPYEIFIPVFEERSDDIVPNGVGEQKSKSNYFDFWGLYFKSSINSRVFDLGRKVFIDETDFFLLDS